MTISREHVLKLCKKWEKELKVKIKKVQIRKMKRKWGSWSEKGILTLNKELLKMPVKCVEYVIVHELLHFLIPYHGRTFKTVLYSYLPMWDEAYKILEIKVKSQKNI